MKYLNNRKQNRVKSPLIFLYLTLFLQPINAQELEVLSTDSNGQITPAGGRNPHISGDGKFVVFESSNLLPNSGIDQIFLRDLSTGQLELISLNATGTGGNAASFLPSFSSARGITEDGRFVVFRSEATDIVNGTNPNGLRMIYLRDRLNNSTQLVSKNSMGVPANGHSLYFTIAPVGSIATVGFNSLANNLDPLDPSVDQDTFIHTTLLGTTRLACFNLAGQTIFNGCQEYSLSDNAQMIAFSSVDGGIVANDTNINKDIFIGPPFLGDAHILLTQNELGVSSNTGSHSPPTVTSDGRYVTFSTTFSLLNTLTDPPNTPDTYFIDILTDTKFRIKDSQGNPIGNSFPTISSFNNLITFETFTSVDPIDTNQFTDIYLTAVTSMFTNSPPILISQNNNTASNTSGTAAARVSSNGKVIFEAFASNLSPIPDTNGASDIFGSNQFAIFNIFTNGFE